MKDEEYLRELADRIPHIPLEVCPQLRPTCAELLYPVEGYCVLAQSPGWFMIPSIEEYQGHCTTPRFHECPWFGDGRDGTHRVNGLRSTLPIRPDVWKPPDMPQSSSGD